MNFHDYVFVNSKKTNKERNLLLGAKTVDVLHAVIGIMTETNELEEAVKKNDVVNIKEEIGDIWWYAALIIRRKPILKNEDIEEYVYVAEDDVVIDKMFEMMYNHIANMQDAIKRIVFYGAEFEEYYPIVEENLKPILKFVNKLAYMKGFLLSEIWDANYRKLNKKRFKNGFSGEDALNRNVDEEYEELKK